MTRVEYHLPHFMGSKLSEAVGATLIVDEVERLEATADLSDGVKTAFSFPD